MSPSDPEITPLMLELVEIKTKLSALVEEFRRVSNGTGFPRCVERQARLEALEKSVLAIHTRLDGRKAKEWWFICCFISQFVGILFLLLKGKLGI